MAQKPMLRAEVYARALRASQNVKGAEYVQALALVNGLSTTMPSVALLLSKAAVGKQVP
jgi:hypothetical protein